MKMELANKQKEEAEKITEEHRWKEKEDLYRET